jgi:hypothetical protein
MNFVFFRTPKPKRFSFKPRYYDPEKEEWERKKAERGLKSDIGRRESLRMEMDKRWRKGETGAGEKSLLSKLITYLFFFLFIGGSIYFILFTDFIEKLIAIFGFTHK